MLGRDREFALLADAVVGHRPAASGAAVIGRPGVGVTTVLRAIADRAARAGQTVLTVRPVAEFTTIPLSLLQSIVTSLPPGVLEDERRAVLVHIERGEPSAHVHASFHTFVERLLSRSRVLLVVDDVADGDEETLKVLTGTVAALRQAPFAILVGGRRWRPGERPAADRLVACIDSLRHSYLCELGPLDDTSIASLVSDLGWQPDTAAMLVHALGGSPYLASVLAGCEAAAEPVTVKALASSLPLLTRSRVVNRLLPTTPAHMAVARAVAALDAIAAPDIAMVRRVVGLDDATADRVLDDLLSAAAIETTDGCVRFCAPFLREIISADVPVMQQRAMYRSAAEILRSRRDRGEQIPAVTIAEHLVHGPAEFDPDRAVIFAGAGDEAFYTSPATAHAWYRRALDSLPLDSPDRPSLQARLARSILLSCSPLAGSVDAARESIDHLDITDGRYGTVAAASGALITMGNMQEAARVLEAQGPTTPSPSMARQRSIVYVHLRRFDEARAQARRALHLTEPETPSRAYAMGALIQVQSETGKTARMAGMIAAQRNLVRDAPLVVKLLTSSYAAYFLAIHGLLEDARERLTEADEQGRQLGGCYPGPVNVARSMLCWHSGNWAQLLASKPKLVDAVAASGGWLHRGLIELIVANVSLERGETVHLNPNLGKGDPPIFAELSGWVLAGVEAANGQGPEARARLRALRGRPAAGGPFRHLLLERHAEVCADLGDRGEALDVCDELDQCATIADGLWTTTVANRTRALVTSDADLAASTSAAAGALGMPFEAARCQALLGTLEEDGRASLLAAMETFRSLGAAPWVQRTATSLRTRGFSIPRSRRSGVLTDSELAVVRLVQQGMRNKDIASHLCYSVRTVETYLARIYTKLGCSSRLELATKVDVRDLTDDEVGIDDRALAHPA